MQCRLCIIRAHFLGSCIALTRKGRLQYINDSHNDQCHFLSWYNSLLYSTWNPHLPKQRKLDFFVMRYFVSASAICFIWVSVFAVKQDSLAAMPRASHVDGSLPAVSNSMVTNTWQVSILHCIYWKELGSRQYTPSPSLPRHPHAPLYFFFSEADALYQALPKNSP